MDLQTAINYIKSRSNSHEITIEDSDIAWIMGINGDKKVVYIDLNSELMDDFHNQLISQIDKTSLSNTKGCLVYFEFHPNVSLFTINDIMSNLFQYFTHEPDIIFGTGTNESLTPNNIKCYLILAC